MSKKLAKPIVLACVSDIHAGSTVAVCPPEGVRLDDGGKYKPSATQCWLWEQWEAFWRRVSDIRASVGKGTPLGILCNGDACDGPGHHGTHQTISNNAESQAYVVQRVFSIPKRLKPDWWIGTKGTPVHVGKAADSESALLKSLGGRRDPIYKSWTWYRWTASLNGTIVDALHHGRSGARPWTKLGSAGNQAAEIALEHLAARRIPPHLAIRSHKHTPYDSGDECPVRVIGLPSWQAPTEYAWKVCPESLANQTFGGIVVVCDPDGSYVVEKLFYRPESPAAWKPPAAAPRESSKPAANRPRPSRARSSRKPRTTRN